MAVFGDWGAAVNLDVPMMVAFCRIETMIDILANVHTYDGLFVLYIEILGFDG